MLTLTLSLSLTLTLALAKAIQTMLAGCAGGDREGSRVTYGNYISMMGLIDKVRVRIRARARG